MLKTYKEMLEDYEREETLKAEIVTDPSYQEEVRKLEEYLEENCFSKEAEVRNAKRFFDEKEYLLYRPWDIKELADFAKSILEREDLWNTSYEALYNHIIEKVRTYYES